MRRLRRFFESTYNKKHSSNDEFIKSIWFVTEDEVFESFAELHDSMDVTIDVRFSLKNVKFELDLHTDLTLDSAPGKLNLERIEAYAAAGLKPNIMVEIKLNNPKAGDRDDRKMHAYAMESLHHIEDYSLYDVKRGHGYLKLYLKQDDNSETTKSLYHKKSARSFKEPLSEFRKIGYTPTVSRSFAKGDKLNLMYTPESKKLYYITLQKDYKIEVEMIDELYYAKNKFTELINNLNQLPDITHVDENFDIGTSSDDSTKGQISVIFTLYAWEK